MVQVLPTLPHTMRPGCNTDYRHAISRSNEKSEKIFSVVTLLDRCDDNARCEGSSDELLRMRAAKPSDTRTTPHAVLWAATVLCAVPIAGGFGQRWEKAYEARSRLTPATRRPAIASTPAGSAYLIVLFPSVELHPCQRPRLVLRPSWRL
jgi:hypothetical protein